MKKIILGLFSLLTVTCFAQTSIEATGQVELTKEQAKEIVGKTMAKFTEGLSYAYTKGVSYKKFRFILLGNAKPTTEGDGMILAAYNYLSNGVSKEDIIKFDDGKALINAMKFSSGLQSRGGIIEPDGTEIFGVSSILNDSDAARAASGCGRWQLWCHVKEFVGYVVDHWETIAAIIRFFL
jgi:hypothetical protein